MLPLTRSRNRARFFGIPFSPSALFQGGTVAGAWYDPSDLSTMFTTDAGTTPVAMPGGGAAVSVGRILDKSGNGNHAISFNNTTARPELRARVNLLTYSEEFDNGAWVKTNSTITADAVANPLTGTVNADALFETTTNGAHAATQSVTTQAAKFKYSVYLKANGRARFCIAGSSGFGGNLGSGVFFDLSTGQYVSGAASGATPSITDAGGGWWLVSYEWTANAATGVLGIYLVDSGTNTSYAGDVTKGIYIWGADLRPANIGANVPAYQRIADANTYDTSGFPLYLRFDGIDDSMYTPANLNLSSTDKVAVFAGVRKQAVTTGFPVEFSAAAESNNGAFRIGVDSGGIEYFASSRGTVSQQVNVDNAAYLPPVSNVVQSSFDISGPSVSMRLNGAAVGTNTASQGTGNFGSYPLFIGSRNNASFWLNGNIYSLIVVGSAVSAGNISATESWVAGRTGIQI